MAKWESVFTSENAILTFKRALDQLHLNHTVLYCITLFPSIKICNFSVMFSSLCSSRWIKQESQQDSSGGMNSVHSQKVVLTVSDWTFLYLV